MLSLNTEFCVTNVTPLACKIAVVTYAQHINWTGAGYVLSFSLNISRSLTFSLTACVKRNVDSMLGGMYFICASC